MSNWLRRILSQRISLNKVTDDFNSYKEELLRLENEKNNKKRVLNRPKGKLQQPVSGEIPKKSDNRTKNTEIIIEVEQTQILNKDLHLNNITTESEKFDNNVSIMNQTHLKLLNPRNSNSPLKNSQRKSTKKVDNRSSLPSLKLNS